MAGPRLIGPGLARRLGVVASYSVNKRAVAHARRLIDPRQYVVDSDWGEARPKAADENAFLESHSGRSTPLRAADDHRTKV